MLPFCVATLLLVRASPAPAQDSTRTSMDMGAMDSSEAHTAAAATAAMAADMTHDAHMRLTPTRPGTAADTARAQALVIEMRRALGKYRNVAAAEADGFRQFLPGVQQPVYHFTNWRWAIAAMFRFEPDKPTSLLYRRTAGGGFELVGAMYTAPWRTSEADLDRRIPLSVARWHEHVNWCLPPRGSPERWREQRDGAPLFGPHSPIATKAACDAAGGRFKSRVFGWMVHVQAFQSDDPKVIWAVSHPGERGN